MSLIFPFENYSLAQEIFLVPPRRCAKKVVENDVKNNALLSQNFTQFAISTMRGEGSHQFPPLLQKLWYGAIGPIINMLAIPTAKTKFQSTPRLTQDF
jgi:hypothetical protein